jgi:Sec-independent protein secretion pathway component TatC
MQNDLHKRNRRLGLILAVIAVFMFVLMLVWAYQYMTLPV